MYSYLGGVIPPTISSLLLMMETRFRFRKASGGFMVKEATPRQIIFQGLGLLPDIYIFLYIYLYIYPLLEGGKVDLFKATLLS